MKDISKVLLRTQSEDDRDSDVTSEVTARLYRLTLDACASKTDTSRYTEPSSKVRFRPSREPAKQRRRSLSAT